jgi:hypothetical protein
MRIILNRAAPAAVRARSVLILERLITEFRAATVFGTIA